jgi:hypothetical protein
VKLIALYDMNEMKQPVRRSIYLFILLNLKHTAYRPNGTLRVYDSAVRN